eukprot:15049584-Ditylum_brightwellii.AAC.2
MKKVRLKEELEISMEWDASMIVSRPPKIIVNIFEKKEVSKDTLKAHIELEQEEKHQTALS